MQFFLQVPVVVALSCLPAMAQEESSSKAPRRSRDKPGVVCDTLQQVERYAALRARTRTFSSRTCAKTSCATTSPMFRANTLYEGAVPARHLDRAAADRQEADRDRREGRRRRGGAWRDRQGQRPGALRATYYALKPDVKVIAPWREWDLTSRTKLIEWRRSTRLPDRQGQARRGAVLGRRQSPARVIRRKGAGGTGPGSARPRISAHHQPGGCARQGDLHHGRFRARRRGGDRRQHALAGRAAHAAQRASVAPTASAGWARRARTVSSA